MYNKQTVFIVACFGLLLTGIVMFTPGALALDLRLQFGLQRDMFFILPFGLLAGSFLSGLAGMWRGYGFAPALACVFFFVALQGIALGDSVWLLKSCIFLCGVGGGLMMVAANSVVADISTRGKWASLSLLGVFPGIGVLIMPPVLGALKHVFLWNGIVSAIGWACLSMAAVFAFVRFPAGKYSFRSCDLALLPAACFLVFQYGFETLVCKHAAAYFIAGGHMEEHAAWYALSLHTAGFIVMRLLAGSVFRTASPVNMLIVSLLLIPAGIVLLQTGCSVAGMVLLGTGLAGGFPVMLGFTGERYAAASGAAFSLVFTIVFAGGMLLNRFAELVIQSYGERHFTTVAFAEWLMMLWICSRIIKRLP